MRKRTTLTKKLKGAKSASRIKEIEGKLINIEIMLQQSHQTTHDRNKQIAIESIKSNPRYFFSYAKKFSKVKTKIGPLLNEKNLYTSSSPEMANIFSDHYKSVFSTPLNNSAYRQSLNLLDSFTDIEFNQEDFHSAIDELSNCSSAGPDGIPAILLKKCKTAVSKPLFIL